MKITFPDYYLKFKCIADRCTDSCCVGWEIDIDEISQAKYASLSGDLGAEIRKITQHGVFPLDKNGRCAFLDCNGLCRIISALGEGYLCDICREHPRYYGIGADGLDGGLGLACPEAARIIISQTKKPDFVKIDAAPVYICDDPYAGVSHVLREKIYDVLYSHSALTARSLFPILAEYADEIAFSTVSGAGVPESPELTALDESIPDGVIRKLTELFSECEALNEEWSDRLDSVGKLSESALEDRIRKKPDAYRSLLFYFTHRYLRECIEDMSAMGRVILAKRSADIIFALSLTYDSFDSIEKAAVLFSKNIEYSTDNINYLIN